MPSQKLAALIDSYQKQSNEQQLILQLLAVIYAPCSLTHLGKCLYELNIRDGSKPLKPETVKTRLKSLLQAGLAEEQNKAGGVRCSRAITEWLCRKMSESGEFERLAKIAQALKPTSLGYYRYSSVDECLRDARIFFYLGKYDDIAACMQHALHNLGRVPNALDFYLQLFLNPLDVAWFERHRPELCSMMAFYASMHQMCFLYRDADLQDFIARHLLTDAVLQTGQYSAVAVQLKLLRGEWQDLAPCLIAGQDPELQALGGAVLLLQGQGPESLPVFEQALVLLRKQTGKRTDYFSELGGVFYILALLKYGTLEPKKLTTLINQAQKVTGFWSAIYERLSLFHRFLQGDLACRNQLLWGQMPPKISSGFRESGMPDILPAHPIFVEVLNLLIKHWVKADFVEQVCPVSQKFYTQCASNGYDWVVGELTQIYCAIDPSKSVRWNTSFWNKPQRFALADLFASKPDWELALDALSHLPVAAKKDDSKPAAEKPTRVIWLAQYSSYNGLSIEPREQKQQAKGGWSKGRAIALRRLHDEADNMDFLSEHDLRLCREIKEFRDSGWYGSGTSFEFTNAMPLALVGHPKLFWADSPDVRVEVVKGDVVLNVRHQADTQTIKINLEPAPALEQKIQVIKESPTRLKVVEFTAEHLRIAQVLSAKGLEIPVSAQERVLQTLTSMSSLLTVHSDIGGGNAQQLSADPTPHLHLLPLGDGLRVALLIKPIAEGSAYFQPGVGGDSVLLEVDGKPLQAKRDLKLEKQYAAQLLNDCTQLANAERDGSGEWLLHDPEHCLEFLTEVQALSPGQVVLEWPEGVRFKVLGQSSGTGFGLKITRDHDWFGLSGELRINETTVIELQQLLGLLNQRQGRFLQLKDGQFIALADEFRRRLQDLKAYAEQSGKKLRLNPLAALTLEDWPDAGQISGDQAWNELVDRVQQARDYQPQIPSTFQAELRDYQLEGYRWLARLAHWGVGACLADDMGLGKTVQGLALLVEQAPNGPSMIVAPTSVCANWQNEANRFAPTLKVQILAGGDRKGLIEQLGPFDVLICSYGLLQQENVASLLVEQKFQTVVLDEAQAIKNIATRRSQAAMNLQAEFKLIMTGTPLENHLGELWNLFRFINPGLLGSLEQFNQNFVAPIERDASSEAKYRLKKLIQPFILRRTKTQVLQELPPRTEIPLYVELSEAEMAFYEALRRESLEILNHNDEANAGQKHLQILAAITKLRRMCCNAQLVKPEVNLPSSKLAAFGDLVSELLDNKHKALVFSQFVDHLQLLKALLDERGISYQYLDGSTPAKQRQLRVDAFQRGEGDLFLISLKAGGVGLNLTAADYVIHMDPWWNPAVEDQASDRAHRMGQQRPVTIYRMIAKHTIEEKIVALHAHKRDLADSLLDGTDVSGKVSADALLELMRER